MVDGQRRKQLADFPSIWMTEGRFLLGCGRDKWRRLWEEVYRHETDWWENQRGVRVNLDSLIKAVYPGMKKDTRGLLANDFLWKLMEERRRSASAMALRQLEKDKNEDEGETS